MQLKWGSYGFPVNGMEVATTSEALRSDAGIPYGYRVFFRVHGYLEAAGQAACTVAENALKVALRKPYQNLTLFTDAGTPTGTNLTGVNSFTGVVVTRGPDFGGTAGAEYANQREFTFEATADYFLNGIQANLLSFHESLSYGGGGPFYIMKRAINGVPQRQMVWPQIEYTVRQSGEAVGLLQYPNAPAPLFPGSLKQSGNFVKTGPDRVGLAFYRNYRLTWEYQFESVTPLVGLPHLWLGP